MRHFFFHGLVIASTLLLNTSCSNLALPESISMEDAISMSYKFDSLTVFLSNGSVSCYNQLRRTAIKYYSDLSKPNNLFFYRILDSLQFPSKVTLRCGKITSADCKNGIEYINAMLDAESFLKNPDSNKLLDYKNNLAKYCLSDYPYGLYLYAICCYLTGDNKTYASTYSRILGLNKFLNDPLYYPLVKSLPKDYSHSECPNLLLTSSEINLGDIRSCSINTGTTSIINTGSTTATIFQTSVSCSCLSVNVKRIIKAGEQVQLNITMDATGPKGPFKKEISIISNAAESLMKVYIYGNII